MASIALEKAVLASVSASWSKPSAQGRRLSLADCSSGRHRTRNARMRAVVSGLQFQSTRDDLVGGLCRGSVEQRLRWNGASVERRGRGRGRGNGIVTMALPADTYWITVAQAVGVAGLMAGFAVVAGILINVRIEVDALAEFKELEEKGLLPEDMIIPDGEEWELDTPLYIFQNKELSSANPTPRNRPVREEFEPQIEIETKPELETATKE